MNRVEEYLSSLDSKQKIMIYLSIIIVFGIIYYYFNIEYLGQKIKTLQKESKKWEVKALKTNKKLFRDIAILKKQLKNLKIKYVSLSDDYKYLQNVVLTSKRLYINDGKFYQFLNEMLSNSNNLNIGASYLINNKEVIDNIAIYRLSFFGKLDIDNYPSLIKFMTKIKNSNALVGFKDAIIFICDKNEEECIKIAKNLKKSEIEINDKELNKISNSNSLFYLINLNVEGLK